MVENDQTAQNLRSAFGGESQAYQRYVVWGDKAEEEGFPNVATLFRAIAYAEQVHAGNHFTAMENADGDYLVASGAVFGLSDTAENLAGAIAGEEHEIKQMYPSYKAVAQNQDEYDAIKTFNYALQAEKIHAELYSEAREAVQAGNDFDLEYTAVCSTCGHTILDEVPDYCPVCGEPSEQYEVFGR